jgi:RNA polymerase sigma factor (sigma-70 family)
VKRPTGLHLIVRKCAEKDAQAQTELFNVLYQPLFDHILSRFGHTLCKEDVEEVVQQTIIQIYIHAERFHGEHNEASAWKWAYQIARNQAHKWAKIYSRSVSVWERIPLDLELDTLDESELFDEIVLIYAPSSPEDAFEEQVLNMLVWQAAQQYLAQLSPREKKLLELRHVQQCTMEQIAEKFGVKRSRIHQLLTAIHLKLRNKLGYL